MDRKERVESWKLKQEKNMLQMTSGGRYDDGKGDMEGIGSNAKDLPMYATCHNSWSGAISFTDALRYKLRIRYFFVDFLTLI